jgi:hypothetical protein
MSPDPDLGNCRLGVERRRHRRFPISGLVEYVLRGRHGEAAMLDVGSGGVFLKAQDPLPVGKPVKLFLEWPAMLDGRYPLRLVIEGRILRSSARGSAVSILRHEYRLHPKAAQAVQSAHPLAMAG